MALRFQSEGQVGGDRRFADAAFPGSDRDDGADPWRQRLSGARRRPRCAMLRWGGLRRAASGTGQATLPGYRRLAELPADLVLVAE